MPDYGMAIKRQDINKDVEDCTPKELVFSSKFPCAKILQTGRYNFTLADGNDGDYTIVLSAEIAFPTIILVFLYDPNDSSYKALSGDSIMDHTQNYRGNFSFDVDELFVTVENYTGGSVNSHFIYFICYA